MAQHVVIRREEFVVGSKDRPEPTIFTQTHQTRKPIPYGQIHLGETVWMKWSGGPIIARAKVEGLRFLENCSVGEFREATAGTRLYDHDVYWETRPDRFNGMLIHVTDGRWLDQLIQPDARSYGAGWVVLDTRTKETQWLSRLLEEVEATAGPSPHSTRRSLPLSVRFHVLKRDDFMCTYCGRRPPAVELQVDHVVPFSKGGSSSLDNLATACNECNLGKSDHRI